MLQTNKIRPYYNEFNKKKCQAMALLMAEGIIEIRGIWKNLGSKRTGKSGKDFCPGRHGMLVR